MLSSSALALDFLAGVRVILDIRFTLPSPPKEN